MWQAYFFMDVVIAYVLDLIIGDPYRLPHPVRFIGKIIKKTECALRGIVKRISKGKPGRTAAYEKIAGVLLAVFVLLFISALVYILLMAAGLISIVLFHAVNIYIIYTALAVRCLAAESSKVLKALEKGNLQEARKKLSMIVGRETEHLNEEEVIRAVVETTAENTVDGVVSPLIYALLGSFFGIGGPLVYAYKAVNTLDSMVGYKNEKYLNMGWASAKLDDMANYIPARISGFIIPVSAFITGMNCKRSFNVMLRDRRNHKSPNCAYPEAAVAGALGVRIGGANVYFGQMMYKPVIGDDCKKLETKDISNTVKLMYTTSALILIIGLVIGIIIT